MEISRYIQIQKEFSEDTFGPGKRTEGIIDHIKKELGEIEVEPLDLEEWVDVVMLALDGAWRAGHSSDEIENGMREKLIKNMGRDWPDWRTAEPGKAIEHIRGEES